jgi:type I restriction enzyme M protein
VEREDAEGRWRVYGYDELVARDKVSLDLTWLRDESLEDSANLPEPHVLAQGIADDLRSALEQVESILGDLQARVGKAEWLRYAGRSRFGDVAVPACNMLWCSV